MVEFKLVTLVLKKNGSPTLAPTALCTVFTKWVNVQNLVVMSTWAFYTLLTLIWVYMDTRQFKKSLNQGRIWITDLWRCYKLYILRTKAEISWQNNLGFPCLCLVFGANLSNSCKKNLPQIVWNLVNEGIEWTSLETRHWQC